MLVLAGACLGLAAIGALDVRVVSNVHQLHLGWSDMFALAAPRWLVLAAVLPLLFHVAWRRPPWPMTTGRVLLHLLLFVGLSAMYASVQSFTFAQGGHIIRFGFLPWAVRSLFAAMPTVGFMYAAILLMAWGIAQSRERHARELRAAQLETQLNAARLDALRAQLHPHFLFNTLNGIAAVVAALQPQRAVRAIEQLGELLHASFSDDGRNEIPLHEEIALVERYLALQRLRFDDRLQYTLDVDPRVSDWSVPVLILQPSVENAVRHGMAGRRSALHLRVAATLDAEAMEVIVENDGRVLPLDWTPSPDGVGLSNTRARLAATYGGGASVVVTRRESGGVVVRMRIPRLLRDAGEQPLRAQESLQPA